VPSVRALNITDAGDLARNDDSSLSEIGSDLDVDNLEVPTGADGDA